MSGTAPKDRPSTNDVAGPSSTEDTYLRKVEGRRSATWILAVVAIAVVVALLGGAYAAGWIGKPASTAGSGYEPPCASLTGAGSTFVNPLMSFWTDTYARTVGCHARGGATQVQVNYMPVGSGTGISDLTKRLVDFGASDAPLTTAQVGKLPGPVVTMPDAAGAVTILYHLAVTNATGATVPLKLTGQVIAAIYLTAITAWNDPAITALNPGSTIPSQQIYVQHRLDGSGTTYAFTTYLSAENATWKNTIGSGTTVNWPTGPNVFADSGSAGVANAVNTQPGAIGYAELSYAHGGGSISFAAVQNPAGVYVLPNVTNTAAALSGVSSYPSPTGDWSGVAIINEPGSGTYPIATLTYLMVYTDLGKVYGSAITQDQAQALVSFLWWITHSGQADATGLWYASLPASVVSGVCEVAIGDIHYNGAVLTSH